MRRAVFTISLAYVILFAWTWHEVTNTANDAAGYGMATGFLVIGMWSTAIFAVPAVILAALNKWIKFAFVLSLIPAGVIVLAKITDVI